MTIILALDTSSENCSVALIHQGETHQLLEQAPRNHTRLILPMLQTLLAQQSLVMSDLGAIAFGCGPGSFTGIRIAAGVAQGLAFGLNIPIYAISNLQALALQSYLQNGVSRVLACIDARMGEVYWCWFDISVLPVSDAEGEAIFYRVTPLLDEQVSAPDQLFLPESFLTGSNGESCSAIGSGLALAEQFPLAVNDRLSLRDTQAQPEAQAIAHLTQAAILEGRKGDMKDALPSYVRDTVTWNKLPGRE